MSHEEMMDAAAILINCFFSPTEKPQSKESASIRELFLVVVHLSQSPRSPRHLETIARNGEESE